MKEKPVLPLLVSMALPNVISMLVNSLYNIVDSLFVARISEDAMTALSLVFPIQNFANAIAIGFGIGINAMIALYLGAGDRKKAETAATHGMALSLIHGILITILSIAIMPGFLRRFTTDESLVASGITYSTIVFLFATINMAALAFEKMFQAVGRMKVTMVALVFGFFAFRSRIKGVYFSIITQAMTYAAMLLFFRNETGFGGNNGFTDFKRILGTPIATQNMRMTLFVLTGVTLLGFFLLARWLVRSKFGRVLQAVRDAESRVMFSGYAPLPYKLTIWTISAMMCGVAGALYVPQVGIINPGEMSAANSIEIAVWAAVGGRATLIGPIVGAFIVNGAKSWLTVTAPEFWLYFLGALFIAVTLFLPDGVVGLVKKLKAKMTTTKGAAQ